MHNKNERRQQDVASALSGFCFLMHSFYFSHWKWGFFIRPWNSCLPNMLRMHAFLYSPLFLHKYLNFLNFFFTWFLQVIFLKFLQEFLHFSQNSPNFFKSFLVLSIFSKFTNFVKLASYLDYLLVYEFICMKKSYNYISWIIFPGSATKWTWTATESTGWKFISIFI